MRSVEWCQQYALKQAEHSDAKASLLSDSHCQHDSLPLTTGAGVTAASGAAKTKLADTTRQRRSVVMVNFMMSVCLVVDGGLAKAMRGEERCLC